MVSVEKLKKLRIFKGTSDRVLKGLAKEMAEVSFEKGDTVINEGEVSGSIFLVTEGVVVVEKKLDKEGVKTKVVARLEAEEFFGEMSFLENKPHSATIKAQEKTHVLRLPRQALEDLSKNDPQMALEQVLTFLSGVSSRLRSTTSELVTIFEVARGVGQPLSVTELMAHVFLPLSSELGENASLAFYRWNIFNEEYDKVLARGPEENQFPDVIDRDASLCKLCLEPQVSLADLSKEKGDPAPFPKREGHLILSRADSADQKEGLFVYYGATPDFFDSGKRQLMETVSAVLAPALVSARNREEEASRNRLEQNRQQGYSL